jgi:transcriptional regulator with XRE-family HTH domain
MDKQSIRIIIGQNIRQWRQKRRMSEQMLADQIGITLKRLRKYEIGHDSPTCDELIAIATLLKCSVDDLCRGKL